MWTLSTIAKRIARIALAATLVVAPVAPAAASCMSSKPATDVTAGVSNPCDTPCKDCSHGETKSCERDCVVVTMGFIAPRGAGDPAFPDARVDPEVVTTARALVHPPDTPPPRFLLAQF